MEIEELYKSLERIQARGEIGNAYGGCGTVEEDSDVLMDFFDCIAEVYEDAPPPWAEAFLQIFAWQFQTFHEGAKTYYENLNGTSDFQTQLRVHAFLREGGYDAVAEPYGAAICEDNPYPEAMRRLLPDAWMSGHEETVWAFYVDILEKHRSELLQRSVS